MFFQIFVVIITLVFYKQFKPYSFTNIRQSYYRKKMIRLCCSFLILQSGLRHLSVGTDTYAYALMYIDIGKKSWTEVWDTFINYYFIGTADIGVKDVGYVLLQKCINFLGFNYRFFFVFVAIFFFTAYGRLLYKYTKTLEEVVISIVLYETLFYSFYSITGIRQVIAMSGLLFIVPYAINRNFFKFFIGLLILATIHKSCLVFAPFYFFGLIKKPKMVLYASFLLLIPMFLFGKTIVSFFISGTIFDEYSQFLEGTESAGAYTFLVFILLMGICIIYSWENIYKESSANSFFSICIAIAIVLTPLTMIDPSNMRIVHYFSIFTLIMLPKFCSTIEFGHLGVKQQIVIFILLISIIQHHFTYGFFWEEMKLNPVYFRVDPVSDFDLY